MRRNQRPVLTVLLLLLMTAGQALSAFSSPCTGGDAPLSGDSNAASMSMDFAMDHAHHAGTGELEEAGTSGCCEDGAVCQMAECAAPVALLNSSIATLAPYASCTGAWRVAVLPQPVHTSLFRPPIIV